MKLSLLPVQGAALALLSTAPGALAQVSHGGAPAGLSAPTPRIEVAAPDVRAYMLEDEAMGYRPLRYGALVDVELTLEDGTWSDLPDGSRTWRLALASEGAHSLAVEFDLLWLPEGAELFVIGQNGDFLGAYTEENHHLDSTFVHEPIAGSVLTLEIDVPEGAEDPVLFTRSLIYDYRDIFGLMDGTVRVGVDDENQFLGACLIDVNCPEGDPWEVQKRATMRTLSGGSLCSGALINNTASDGTNYVLTADHCGQGTNTVFRFQYERPNCGSGSAPTTMSVSGCSVLATNANFDNRLLRINATIPNSYEPYYAGWSRGVGTGSLAFAMGHPGGGPKKISIDNNGMSMGPELWTVFWNAGMLEGGSSGGPLFDQNGRVRGPACCVTNFTCGQQTAFFGRFDRFFTTNNLAQWLDPLGTDQTLLDGYDPLCVGTVANYCSTSPNSVGSGASIAASGPAQIGPNNFGVQSFGCPANQVGIFYYGGSETSQPFGNGFRCVGGTTYRLPIIQTDIFGFASYQLDFDNLPLGSTIAPGDTVKFQFWYRDPAGGGAAFNLSNGLSVTFCP